MEYKHIFQGNWYGMTQQLGLIAETVHFDGSSTLNEAD